MRSIIRLPQSYEYRISTVFIALLVVKRTTSVLYDEPRNGRRFYIALQHWVLPSSLNFWKNSHILVFVCQ